MEQELRKVLMDESKGTREFFKKLQQLEVVEPEQVKLFFNFILNLSSELAALEQYVFGILKSDAADSMMHGFEKLDEQSRQLLVAHLEQMTQASSTNEDDKATHQAMLSRIYTQIGYGRSNMYLFEYQNKENPLLVELTLVSTLFKLSKQKISITVSMMQVVQFLEPFIIETMKHLLSRMVKPGTTELIFSEMPAYIVEHEHKEYHKHPMLLKYYADDAPKMIQGYCRIFTHTINDAFVRLNEIIFSETTSTEPHVAERITEN